MTEFAWEPIYGSMFFAVLAVVAVFAVVVFVTPPTENPKHRRLLIALRAIAALVLLLAAIGPSLIRTDNKPAEAILIVAADTSRSMTLPDGDGGDRWSTQVKAWKQLAAGMVQLDDALDVQLLTYDRSTSSISGATANALDEMTPDGDLTDLAVATRDSIQAAAGKPIAGVVFFGDGAQTAPIADLTGSSATQSAGAQRSVETLNLLGVPFWPVPIGPAGGASASRDASVEALPESYRLFAGNEVDITFQLQARGLAGTQVPVRLTWIDAAGKRDEAAVRTFVPRQSNERSALSIPLIAPEPGIYQLVVETDEQAGELVTSNNRQISFVEVRAGGGRILYLYGTVRQEQSAVRRSLRRFPDLDLTYDWVRSDRTWPVDLDVAFKKGRFDIYILDDVDADALGEEQLEALKEVIADGAGLVMLGGYHTYGPGGYANSTLADVIPIRMDNSVRSNPRSKQPRRAGPIPGHIAGPIKIELAKPHPITSIGGGDEAHIWQDLPPLKGANRIVGPKVAPGIEVLLQTASQQPLLVVGEYGRGRVATSAIDSTWQWRREGKTEEHRRFWRQMVLWLLAREESSGDKIRIQLDSRRFAIEDPPEFRATLDALGDKPAAVNLVTEIVDANEKVVPLEATPIIRSGSDASNSVASIKGKLPTLKAGFYKLRVRPSDPSSKIEPAEMAFQAIDASREMSRSMADPVYLRQLAQLTADHGGAAFAPDQIDELIETIAKRRRKAESPVVEKHRLGDGPWTGWLVFLIFATALTIEWYLRRSWGMA